MKNLIKTTLLLSLTLLICSCAAGIDEAIDEARFALDGGDYSKAITALETEFAADPTNIEAAVILAAAYAGRANIELTTVIDDLMDTAGTDSTDDFAYFRNKMEDIISDSPNNLPDLRSAISTLNSVTTAPTEAHRYYSSYYLQLGMLQTLEAFSRPIFLAQPTGETSVDVTQIVADDRTNIETDFINADDNLILAGLESDNQLIQTLRENFCTLKAPTAGDTSSDEAFSLGRLRDLITCQLSGATPTTSTVTTCADFDVSSCDGAGDTSL